MEMNFPVECPFCGQPFAVYGEIGMMDQEIVTDCEVCCRPISVQVSLDPIDPEAPPFIHVSGGW